MTVVMIHAGIDEIARITRDTASAMASSTWASPGIADAKFRIA